MSRTLQVCKPRSTRSRRRAPKRRKASCMFSLKDEVALVTCASQGIRSATSVALAGAGAKVAVAARTAETLASLVAEIEAAGGEALAVPMDVADAAQVKAGFQQTLAKFGRLDILVNNAAITRDTLALRMKLED